MDKVLKSILDRDPEKNIAALGFFTNYQVKDYFIESSSVLAFGKSEAMILANIDNFSDSVNYIK